MAPARIMRVQGMVVPVQQYIGEFTRRRDGLFRPMGGLEPLVRESRAQHQGPLMHRYHIPEVFLYVIHILVSLSRLPSPTNPFWCWSCKQFGHFMPHCQLWHRNLFSAFWGRGSWVRMIKQLRKMAAACERYARKYPELSQHWLTAAQLVGILQSLFTKCYVKQRGYTPVHTLTSMGSLPLFAGHIHTRHRRIADHLMPQMPLNAKRQRLANVPEANRRKRKRSTYNLSRL